MAEYLSLRLVLWSLLLSICQAASITIQFQPSALISNPSTLPPSTHATLTSSNGVTISSPIRADNTIQLTDITSAGSSLLSIFTQEYTIASYRIDTSLQGTETVITLAAQHFPGSQWSDVGPSLLPQSQSQVQQPDGTYTTAFSTRPITHLTITPRVLSKKQFYEQRQGFSPLDLLRSPMILLGLVALGFTFGMPYLLENMDPEMRKEYEEIQKKGPTAAITGAMQGKSPGGGAVPEVGDLAGWLAGSGKKAATSSGSAVQGSNAGDLRKR